MPRRSSSVSSGPARALFASYLPRSLSVTAGDQAQNTNCRARSAELLKCSRCVDADHRRPFALGECIFMQTASITSFSALASSAHSQIVSSLRSVLLARLSGHTHNKTWQQKNERNVPQLQPGRERRRNWRREFGGKGSPPHYHHHHTTTTDCSRQRRGSVADDGGMESSEPYLMRSKKASTLQFVYKFVTSSG